MSNTVKTVCHVFLTLLVSFLRPLAISASIFTAIYFLMGARFGYVHLLIFLTCAIIGITLALPYGAAGIVIQLVSWLARSHAGIMRSFLSPFLYSGISGAYMLIYDRNPRMFSYHEQPFAMPSWSELFFEGLDIGIVFGGIGIVIYCLVKIGKKIVEHVHK